MAVDIDLKIYKDAAESRLLACVHLYFGRAVPGNGWKWVEANGMSVEPPNALDDRSAKRGKVVSSATLLEWIRKGYLSPDPWGNDTSGDFLNSYPENATFRLSFLDWS